MGRGLLIIVSGLFIVYGIVQNSLNQRQNNITQYGANYAEETQSETIANAMADLAFAEINQNPGETYPENLKKMEILDGTGSVDIEHIQPFPDNPFIEHKVITAKGKYNGDSSTVEVRAQRRAFSRYSYFTVQEPTIYFTDGDVLNGPVHTNGTIHVNGDATFNGRVTSAGGCDGCNNHDPEFNEGADFEADEINLPVEVPELADEASNGGLKFDEVIRINFFNDNSTGTNVGKASIQKCINMNNNECQDWGGTETHKLDDYNGIISSSEDIEVEGTLNGDVTVHSEKDVEIMGDIRYKHKVDPPENPDPENEDFLGIVSEDNTIVDENAHTAEGTEDLDIHASIMALAEDGSFTVEDYDEGNERGYLNILGGLIQYERGAVGQGKTFGGHSGFLKNYTYDERFLGRSPRGFPRSDIYDFVSWKTKYGNNDLE